MFIFDLYRPLWAVFLSSMYTNNCDKLCVVCELKKGLRRGIIESWKTTKTAARQKEKEVQIMNKKFRVEFNTTGFYSGQGVWETLDEIAEVEAETAQEAIELTIDWINGEIIADVDDERYIAPDDWAWRATEIVDGEYDYNNWQFRD